MFKQQGDIMADEMFKAACPDVILHREIIRARGNNEIVFCTDVNHCDIISL
jgi:hypothetical protein